MTIKTIIMKHFFLLTFCVFLSMSSLNADEFVVKSFNKIDNKVLTNKNKIYDDNDELSAIVLVRTSIVNLGISASTPIVSNVEWVEGDYKVYMTAGTRMIKFYKLGFKTLEYTFQQRLEKGNFYLLELEYKRTDAKVIGNTMGFVIIESIPEGATVWLDREETGLSTPFSRALNEGFYRFTLKKELHKDYAGDFTIKANQNTGLSINLNPNYGKLSIITSPENEAEIFVDGKNTSKQSPAEIDFLSIGNHRISIKKGMYETFESNFNIRAGETTILSADLVSAFGTVEIKANEGDDIFIDRQKIGTSIFKGRISKGQHLLEVIKAGYYPESQTLNIIAGQSISKTISLKAKIGVLSINSNPLRADIFLNNELQGQTPKFINNLKVGSYKLKIQVEGYATIEKQVVITENQTTSINETFSDIVNVKNNFHVKFVQDNRLIEAVDNNITLKKKEFVIVLIFSEPMGLLINASFNSRTYDLAIKGIQKEELNGFTETGMAEGLFNPEKMIIISNTAPNYWYYNTHELNRFDDFVRDDNQFRCRRIIQNFHLSRKKNIKVEDINTPVFLVFISQAGEYPNKFEVKRECIKINWEE